MYSLVIFERLMCYNVINLKESRYIKHILNCFFKKSQGNTAYIPLFKTGYRKTPGKNAESIDLCPIIAQRRTESDRQGFPVSQIQIRQCEHDEVFGCLFSQTSVSCLTIAEKLFNDSKDVLYFTTDR